MNFNMMYRRILVCVVLVLLSGFGYKSLVWASESKQMPKGDILIIYSDGSDENAHKMVNDIVEILTYQSFRVSYGTASESMEYMDQFSYVICYDLTTYPKDFMERIKQYESKYTSGNKEEPHHILFVGNKLLKDYLDYTKKYDDYELVDSSTGKISYTFDGLSYRTGIVKEDYYLFLKNINYQSGNLIVNEKNKYYCGGNGVITHIPVTDISNSLVKAIFIKEVAQWKWPFHGTPNIFAQYIVINKVYPYQNPDKLLEVVKILSDEKTPFIISVMPMYVNGDYPAMTRFCEILRYAQSNGGSVIINAPNNQMVPFDKNVVLDYLAQALQIYNKQGVYPLALQVPRNWLFNKDTIEVMSHFKTIVTSEQEDLYVEQSDMVMNQVYKDGHQWIGSSVAIDDLGTSSVSAYSTAVSISIETDTEEIHKMVKACRSSFIPLKSLWDMEHSYWLEKDLMTYRNQGLVLNGKKKDLNFVPSTYEKKYNYHRNMLQRFSRDLTSQNRMLVVFVGITSLLFLLFIFFARYNNRRNYFIRGSEDEGD